MTVNNSNIMLPEQFRPPHSAILLLIVWSFKGHKVSWINVLWFETYICSSSTWSIWVHILEEILNPHAFKELTPKNSIPCSHHIPTPKTTSVIEFEIHVCIWSPKLRRLYLHVSAKGRDSSGFNSISEPGCRYEKGSSVLVV